MKLFYSLLFGLSLFTLKAQEGTLLKGNYTMSFPLSQRDYISKPSVSGFGFGFGKMFETDFSLSLELNWNRYYQHEDRNTYYFEGGAVTTELHKYRYQVPMVLSLGYTFLQDWNAIVKPYVGMGIGLNYLANKIYFSSYQRKEHSTGFLMQPKIGAALRLDDDGDFNFFIESTYNYATNHSSELDFKHYSAINVSIGTYLIIE